MAKNPQSKDEALEALDFIVNVLKEHERDLDKLISELATVTEQIGETGELASKVDKVEEKISNLQKEIAGLTGVVSNSPNQLPAATSQPAQTQRSAATQIVSVSPSVMLRCQNWEDFQKLAAETQTVSFNYKEDTKILEAYAIRGNQLVQFTGVLPKFSVVLKSFLSKELGVSEQCILEGSLALGQ